MAPILFPLSGPPPTISPNTVREVLWVIVLDTPPPSACPLPSSVFWPHLVIIPVDVVVKFSKSLQAVGSRGIILWVACGAVSPLSQTLRPKALHFCSASNYPPKCGGLGPLGHVSPQRVQPELSSSLDSLLESSGECPHSTWRSQQG
jgi:hypothetical protein